MLNKKVNEVCFQIKSILLSIHFEIVIWEMFLQNGILLSDEGVKIVVNSLDDQEKGIIQINVFKR